MIYHSIMNSLFSFKKYVRINTHTSANIVYVHKNTEPNAHSHIHTYTSRSSENKSFTLFKFKGSKDVIIFFFHQRVLFCSRTCYYFLLLLLLICSYATLFAATASYKSTCENIGTSIYAVYINYRKI